MSTTTADAASGTVTYQSEDHPTNQPEASRLRRSADDRMLAGVAGGIARYLNVDVTLVRVGIAALVLLTGAGAALYIAAWLLIPADGEDQSVAEAWIARRRDRVRY
jgi:phage shock protein PspC (stress-responsive transcriptional regulator)